MRVMVLICVAVAVGIFLQPGRRKSVDSLAMVRRARVGDGNLSRLQAVMKKAQRGEPITVGFIGGSITYGERATDPGRAYAELVTRWWGEQFPKSHITEVNAGVPGTGSAYGCLRVGRDLISHHPDFVVVEFGVNDRNDLAHAETYEGVVRQLMEDADWPAVLLLFMMHRDGSNAQEFESAIGRQYGLPMVSFRDAVWPGIAGGRMKLDEVIADSVHPSDRGHALIAAFIDGLLADCLAGLPEDVGPVVEEPEARFSNLFAHTQMLEAGDLKAVSVKGWTFDSGRRCWKSDVPGSVIEFDVSGRLVDLLYGRLVSSAGTVAVSVDDGSPVICDGWFDGTWAGYCQVDVVGRGLLPGVHRVRVELLQGRNARSGGNAFEILGMGSAGN